MSVNQTGLPGSPINSRSSDSLNNFSQGLSKKLGDALGNPTIGRPDLDVPFSNNRTKGDGIANGMYKKTNNTFNIFETPLSNDFIEESFASSGKMYDKQSNPKLFTKGFTPHNYYKKNISPRYSGQDPEFFISEPPNSQPIDTIEKYFNNKNSLLDYKDFRTSDFKYKMSDVYGVNKGNFQAGLRSLDDFTYTFQSNENNIPTNQYDAYSDGEFMTTSDNEDPVFFGFEIELSVNSSPILNGEAENFIKQMEGKYSEISSKLPILKEFQKELKRYFKFSGEVSQDELLPLYNTENSQFGSTDAKKRYYVRGIKGLQNLNEGNTPDNLKQFVDYRTDKIDISFYEDTTLNLGTLYSLYKQLYWSRLNGKSLLPPNLLRFDCKIIVSELRNFVRVRKKILNGEQGYQILKDNLSRYVYYLYECQLFFNNPSHPDEIDMGERINPTMKYDVTMDYKYSNMSFERFVPSNVFNEDGRYYNITNATRYGTQRTDSEYFNPSIFYIPENAVSSGTISTTNTNTVILDEYYQNSVAKNVQPSPNTITNLKQSNKERLKQKLKTAGQNLFQNLKSSALNEAQRRLNDRFRLLNDSLNRIRDSYGITSRMSPPQNVYNNIPANSFFFDVQNSLRQFGGDTLASLFGTN